MNKLIYVLAAVALLSTAILLFNNKTKQLSSNISVEISNEFQAWKAQYNKNYNTQQEELYRMAIYALNYEMIKAFNHAALYEFTMGQNQFMDLSNFEFKNTYLGMLQAENPTEGSEPWVDKNIQVPTSVNWTAQGKVAPVENQGQCGSCWAFSACASMDSCSAIFGTGLQQFSEQQLVDCSGKYGNQGCNGGLMDNAFNYVIANGITTESAYPYTGVQGTCKVNGGAFKIKSYTNIPKGNCNALQTAVAQQPTSVGVDAQTWQFYSSGVFSLCGTSIDHGVLAAGYTPTYWYVKNSWGTSWGMSGYIELKFGNTCGICNQASYPNL